MSVAADHSVGRSSQTYPKTLEIDVTATDIRLGRRESVQLCPIARAAKRRLHKKGRIFVDGYEIEWTLGAKDIYWDLPVIAKRFVQRFDDGRPVKPFKFKARFHGEF